MFVVQDEALELAVKQHGEKNWKLVALSTGLVSKTEAQCYNRWSKFINPKLVKGPWTDEVSNHENLSAINIIIFKTTDFLPISLPG